MRARSTAETAAWALVLVAVSAGIQAWTIAPVDADMAYHVAVGRLIREHGILRSFPWTPFSWLADHYADKELLYHLLLVPLAGLPWITAAKIVGALSGAVALLALYGVLRAEGVRLAGLWALFPLVACDAFLWRFGLGRSFLLSIALGAVVLWAAARERALPLAVASALYPWTYVAWFLPLALAGLAEAARFLGTGRVRWRTFALVAGPLALGVLLHPNGWNLLRLTWIVSVEVLVRGAWGGREGLDLGLEFLPFSAEQWARWLLACVAMTLAALALSWRQRRADPTGLAFALAAAAFGLLTVRSARFNEYFVPFSVAAFALASRHLRRRWLLPAAAAATLAYTAVPLWETMQGLRRRTDLIPPPLVETLQQRIPPGAQVYTCDWGTTGLMMLALPERRFMVALDPTLFYVKDPELYRLWFAIPRRPPPEVAQVIRSRFGARFVMCLWDQPYRRFFDQLVFEPGVQTVLVDEEWNVYDLGEPERAPGPGAAPGPPAPGR